MSGISWFKENAGRFEGDLRFDEPLSKHTYYRIGGPADVLVMPKGLGDLKLLAEGLAEGVRVYFVGSGSNLLASDEGFRGVAVKTGKMNLEISEPAEGVIRTGASVHISSFLRKAVGRGWGGFEFLTGVPGSMGGAVFMNAGTHLGEVKDRIRAVETVPLTGPEAGEVRRIEGDGLGFSYRKNHFVRDGELVWAAEWNAVAGDPAEVKKSVDETLARRKRTQPIDAPSCGSVFKNPREHDMRSWEVIEKIGLRGYQIGQACFSEKHPNFIVNLGGARAEDVRSLIELAKKKARDELGIDLQEEVRYLGFRG